MEGQPLEILKAHLQAYKSPSLPELPPFTGGAIGFFGYDLLQYYEDLPAHQLDDLQMDDLHFMFCDQIIVFDHFKQQMKVIANVHIEPNADEASIIRAYEEACDKIEVMADRLSKQLPPDQTVAGTLPEDVEIGEIASN